MQRVRPAGLPCGSISETPDYTVIAAANEPKVLQNEGSQCCGGDCANTGHTAAEQQQMYSFEK